MGRQGGELNEPLVAAAAVYDDDDNLESVAERCEQTSERESLKRRWP